MRGGLVFFRGAGSAARAYLESDHSHADEYYLEHGTVTAQWSVWENTAAAGQEQRYQARQSRDLTGEQYQSWVDWKGIHGDEVRGTPRTRSRINDEGFIVEKHVSPRFVEMTVNCDKSLSVAAALSPGVSDALDQAQAAAVEAMSRYVAENSVTRVGDLGAQRFVDVEQLESVAVVHRSSRAGDPHRHVHVQWNTRVFAEGKWRGMYTGATLLQQGALRGIGEAAIVGDARLQLALAEAGFTFDAATGKVVELEEHAVVMSKRAQQIEANRERFEAQWRAEHPGQSPSAALEREWDAQAWAFERPQKQHSGDASENRWIAELRDAELQIDGFVWAPIPPARVHISEVDVEACAEEAVTVLESERSAWSLADLEGALASQFAKAGAQATPEEVRAHVHSAALRLQESLVPLPLPIQGVCPDWMRTHTSERVIRVETEITESFRERGLASGLTVSHERIGTLNEQQSFAARALATRAPLIVVEGAAGSGKTTMLKVARDLSRENGQQLCIVTPTLRAANEAKQATGANALSAHKLAHAYGFRWDDTGRWTRLSLGYVEDNGHVYTGPGKTRLPDGARLVIDEAGMCDQDLTHALLTIADEEEMPVALLGDRQQLPAIGRGGVLDLAVAQNPHPIDLTEVHRFRDPEYADLMDDMRARRNSSELFDRLLDGEHIRVWDDRAALDQFITQAAITDVAGGKSVAVAVDTNEKADQLNRSIQHARAQAGLTAHARYTAESSDGCRLRRGDALMTLQNDYDAGVANRDVWEVDRVHKDGSVTVKEHTRKVYLSADYVQEHTRLAYASTVYGVQGATVDRAYSILTDSSSAQAAYVSATRGREINQQHIVAESTADAKDLFENVMRQETGDRGLASAVEATMREAEGMDLDPEIRVDTELRNRRISMETANYQTSLRAFQNSQKHWEQAFPGVSRAQGAELFAQAKAAAQQATTDYEQAQTFTRGAYIAQQRRAWSEDVERVETARVRQQEASLMMRGRREREAREAEHQFLTKWGEPPAPEPSPQLVKRCTLQADKAPEVIAAKAHATNAQNALTPFRGHDFTRTKAPTPPTVESPLREWEKDQQWAKQFGRPKTRAQQTKHHERSQAQTLSKGPEISL